MKQVLDRWARENAGRRKSHPPFDELPDVQRDVDEQRDRRAERQARRGRPEEKEARKRSRRAFKRLDRAGAIGLARDEFSELFSKEDRRLLPLEDGERVVRYTGERTALVDTPEGAPSIVDSTQPLRARDDGGELRPVDFDLEPMAGGWEPANVSVAVQFGERAEEAFSFPGDFSVGIPGVQAAGTRTGNEIFYSDVATDTDAWFGPSPTGVRFAFQLRSEDAPEELRLAVGDASGVELRVTPDAKGVAMFKRGERLGIMSAPLAFDADKQEIDVRLRVEGREVVIEVPHRGRDARYPIVVDPIYENQDSWKYGNGNVAGWRYIESVPQFPHAFGDACCGLGFYIWRNPNQWFWRGWLAEYQYFSPTVWSYIHRADFMHVRHASYATNTTQGMWSTTQTRHQHQWTQGYSFDNANNAISVCADGGIEAWQCDDYVNFEQSRGNYVQSSLWANVNGSQPAWAWNYFGGARIWMSDPEPPTPLYFEESPSGWVDDVPARGYSYNPNEAHVRFGDRGLGMWGLWMDVPGRARQYSNDWGGCTGAQSGRCPESRAHTFSYAGINEGQQTVTVTGQDVLGRTASASKTLKIDRTGPAIEGLAGSLLDAEGTRVSGSRYRATVTARDGASPGARAGVARAELLVDGQVRTTTTATCTAGQCPDVATLHLDLDTAGLLEGEREMRVRIVDGANNSTLSDPWFVHIDLVDDMEQWLQALTTYVDGASPLPLIGAAPTPPQDYRNPAPCLVSEQALKVCYDAPVTWQRTMATWLDQNLVTGSVAAGLPEMPAYVDSADPETTALMDWAATLFQLTADVRADPLTRRVVTTSFERSLNKEDAAYQAIQALAAFDIRLHGEYVASDKVFSAGTGDQDPEDTIPVTTLIPEQIENFYVDHLDNISVMRDQLLAEDAATSPPDPAIAEELGQVSQYRDALQRRDPFVSGYTAEVRSLDVLRMATADSSEIKALSLERPADQYDHQGAAATDRAAVREAALASSAPEEPGEPIATAAVRDTSWMPSALQAKTYLIGRPNRYRHQPKRTVLSVNWRRQGSLRYYRSKPPRQRAFEVTGRPYEGDPFSDSYHGSWDSNLPRPYRDDISSDNKYKGFGIGSASARSIRMNKRYTSYYETNGGAFNTRDDGRVQLDAQAPRRARTVFEKGYCYGRGGGDKFCYFKGPSAVVGTYPIRFQPTYFTYNYDG